MTRKRDALRAEQAHVDRVHDRVEALRRRADAHAAAAVADRSGSTFQAVYERDVMVQHHAARAARLTFGDVESLVFGRLDLTDGETLHVGRLSVIDEQGDVLLVDWRARAAAAFYRATAARPEDVARRRTLSTHGHRVDDLDDEILDAEAAERLGLVAVTGQGALLAALSRARTRHMHDIVATIQADQDRIIRSPATGTLVIAGGPGTGKTVVALHRVAYLLYTHRERFEGRGILVVGPSPAFTEYTSRVLPSLGEERTVQRPLAGLAPAGATVDGWDRPEVASVKGSLAMVEVCRRMVAAVLPPLPPTTRVGFHGTTVTVNADRLAQLRAGLVQRITADREGASYHARRGGADESLRSTLWAAWRRAHRASGGHAPEQRRGTGFDAVLEELPEVTMLRRCWWPDLDPAAVLAAFARGELALSEVAGTDLDNTERALLQDAWDGADGWTVDDVALLDELAALLGPRAEEPERPRREEAGIRLTSDRLRTDLEVADVTAPGYRDFAHVVVDEAQDLSPMQWRAVARRGPYASFTVVGDLAQRSRVGEPSSWEAIAQLIARRQVAVSWLTINYRTPVEIVEVARAILAAAGQDPAAVPASVRVTGELPELHRTARRVDRAADIARGRLGARDGTVALIVPDRLRPEVDAAVRDVVSRQDHDDRVVVLDARTAKGLEFDDVIVVAPEEIAADTPVGLHQLYVAVTRATRSLALVTSPDADLPGSDHCIQMS